jgi:putative endonuclease
MSHFVYILYSVSSDLYYIGSSANPEERLKKHLANHRGFTSRAKDWFICFKESFPDKTEALKRERQLKSWKNRDKIRQLIQSIE